jgi:hypothetical protein
MPGLAAHFDHRCDVQRYSLAVDAYNNQARTPGPHLSDVPCRLVIKAQRGFNSLTGQWMVTTAYKLFVVHSLDVKAGDRITNLVDETGSINAHNFEVEAALPHRGRTVQHRTLELRKVE